MLNNQLLQYNNRKIFLIIFLILFPKNVDSIKVFSLRKGTTPDANISVEIEHSEVNHLRRFSICGRFKAPYLPTMENNFQCLLYLRNMWLFNRIDLRGCDKRYEGCTEYYKDKIGKLIKNILLYFWKC